MTRDRFPPLWQRRVLFAAVGAFLGMLVGLLAALLVLLLVDVLGFGQVAEFSEGITEFMMLCGSGAGASWVWNRADDW